MLNYSTRGWLIVAKGQGRSSGQGVKLLIIRDYLRSHATKEHPKNAKAITKYLSSKWGIEASEKTIYNDILRLQMDFQEPIEYNASKWGYYITEPQFEPYELRLMGFSLTPDAVLKVTNLGNTSAMVVALVLFWMRFLAINWLACLSQKWESRQGVCSFYTVPNADGIW